MQKAKYIAVLTTLIFNAAYGNAGEAPAGHPAFQVEVKGSGAPMILIPGLASSGQTWDSTVAHYAGRYQCHVLTLAGFAGEPPAKDFSMELVLQDLSRYITSQRLERPVIVGHSLGGTLALSLAAQHPEQVGKLVIVDSLPALRAVRDPTLTPAQLKTNAGQMAAAMENMPEKKRLEMGRSAVADMASNSADIDRIYQWTKATDWQTEVSALRWIMETDLRGQVGEITAPTLVFGTWIEYSKYATEAAVRQTFELQYKNLKGVQIAMAPTAHHFIMFDQPAWMFTQMDQFLAK